jgi:UDP-N-acetylglucosamine transferase subunit ALG13
MIFVTVGTSPKPFMRLIREMDTLAGWIDEEVIIQKGSTAYTLLHATGCAWMDDATFQSHILSARTIVSHAGAGTIIVALKQRKPLVLVPRSENWAESVDDHQSELAHALHRRRQAIMVNDVQPQTLWNAITYSATLPGVPTATHMLREALTDQLVEWEVGRAVTCTSPGWKG